MKKRITAMFTALVMALSLFTGVGSLVPTVVMADGVTFPVHLAVTGGFKPTPITDASFDIYFGSKTAAQAAADIITEGNFKVNGITVPATYEEYEENGFAINTKAITVDSAENYAANMAKAVTDEVSCGNIVSIYDNDSDGAGDVIEYYVYAAFIVKNINQSGEVCVISRSDISGIKPYDNTVLFPSNTATMISVPAANVDTGLAAGDMALAFMTPSGWRIIKAYPATGVLVDGQDHGSYQIGETSYPDAMRFSRNDIVISNRCGEFTNAMKFFSLNNRSDITVTLWLVETEAGTFGAPAGFTTDSANAQTILSAAIDYAEEALAAVAVSEAGDGSDVSSAWVTSDTADELSSAIDEAKSVKLKADAAPDELNYQTYMLYLKLHGSADDIGAKFAGYDFVGFENQINQPAPEEPGEPIVINADGSTKITDAAFDEYFTDTTANAAVEALLDAGKVSINGLAVPASEDETDCYKIDFTDSLFKTANGWKYVVHKTISADNLSFVQARKELVETASTVRGHAITLSTDSDGNVTGIDIESFEVVRIDSITNENGIIKIDRGDFALETNRVRYDANLVEFKEENFDKNANVGDIAVFWYGGDEEWHLVKADSIVGVVENPAKGTYKVGEWSSVESNVSRYNLIENSRPTQGYTAYRRMGLLDQNRSIVLWNTPNGFPIGFTYGETKEASAENLSAAIANASAYANSVTASEDGEDVASNKLWALQSDIDTFKAAIAAAQEVLDGDSTTHNEIDMAIYALSGAWGSDGSDGQKPQGFAAAVANGAKAEVAFDNDGSTKVTDASFDEYFEGTAAEGIAALLDAGKVSINGLAIPANENETTCYQIDLTDSLFKTENGWKYVVHKTISADNLSFAQARTELVETASTVRGHQTTFKLDEDGHAVSVDIESFEVMKIVYFEDHGGNVDQIKRGDFELETNRVRYDANKIANLKSENFDQNIVFGDVVVFWFTTDGWHMKKADAIVGVVENPAKGTYKVGDWSSVESNVSRYNLIDNSRPTQGYTAYKRLGLFADGVDIILWNTPNGFPIGFSYGAGAKKALTAAIRNAESYVNSVMVSEDGSDVPANKLWAAQEDIDTFKAAIAAAKSVNNKTASQSWDRDAAIYELSGAWGSDGSDGQKPQGFAAATAYGTGEPVVAVDNDGSTKLNDAKYDEYFEGTAAEGVDALLNAGKVYINGIAVPASEDETANYKIDWVDSLFKTENGWKYVVHKTISADNLSFEQARRELVETASTVRGHQTTYYLNDENICEAINIESFEVVRIDNIQEWGHDRVIERGDFELETNRVRFDANEIHFPTECFDPEVKIGDVAVYWYGAEELGQTARWHLVKADSIVGVIENPAKGTYKVGDWSSVESNVSRYNLIEFSRPTQGYTAYKRLGLFDAGCEIVLWNTPNGYPIGFSYGATIAASKANLKKAIANAEKLEASVKASTDGSNIPSNKLWAAESDINDFKAAITAAKKVANANASTHQQVDAAIYALSGAWGSDGSDGQKPQGFMAAVANGSADPSTEPDVPGETKVSELELAINSSVRLTAPEEVSAWESSNEDVVIVSAKGKILAKKYGKAYVTAKNDNGDVIATAIIQTRFTDVDEESAQTVFDSVYWAADNGIVNGFSDGSFGPEKTCTRLQMVIMLWRWAGMPEASEPAAFSDIAGLSEGQKAAVAWAAQEGITKGSNGKFNPNDTVTRLQTVIMLWRALGKPAVDSQIQFNDTKSLGGDSLAAVQWAAENGITMGKDGNFMPNDGCQRRHIAIFLYRTDSLD